jgi:RNA polymerase sigma-70 factor (ECF subfamily)
MPTNPAAIIPELLARIRAGEEDAYEVFFRQWYGRLAEYALRLLGTRDAAEDAAQDVFVAVWKKRASLPEADKIPAYLFRAVRNRSLNQLRAQRTARKWFATLEVEPSIAPVAETVLEHEEVDRFIDRAVSELSPRAREVFQLSRDQGLTYREIGETLGISVKTVETLMGRALKALRKNARA